MGASYQRGRLKFRLTTALLRNNRKRRPRCQKSAFSPDTALESVSVFSRFVWAIGDNALVRTAPELLKDPTLHATLRAGCVDCFYFSNVVDGYRFILDKETMENMEFDLRTE